MYISSSRLTQYCRRGSRVGVAPPPLEFSKYASRETTLHYKIFKRHYRGGGVFVCVCVWGGVVYVYRFKTFLPRRKIYRHYQYIEFMSVARSMKVLYIILVSFYKKNPLNSSVLTFGPTQFRAILSDCRTARQPPPPFLSWAPLPRGKGISGIAFTTDHVGKPRLFIKQTNTISNQSRLFTNFRSIFIGNLMYSVIHKPFRNVRNPCYFLSKKSKY